MKGLTHWLTLAVSVGAALAGGELFGFPWWLRLITVVVVTILMQGVIEIMGRSRAKKRLEGHAGQ